MGVLGEHRGLLGRRGHGDQQPLGFGIGGQCVGMLQRGMPMVAKAAQQPGGPDRVAGPVQVVERLLEQCDGMVGFAGLGDRLGRPGEQLDPVQPGQPIRVGDLVPQLQGALIVPVRFGEGASLLGRSACGEPG